MQSLKSAFYDFARARLKRGKLLNLARSLRRARKAVMPKRNVFKHFENILGHEHGPVGINEFAEGSIAWVIPDFSPGSGGHVNIFRMMGMLKERGFASQSMVILEPHQWNTAAEAKEQLEKHFGLTGVEVALGIENLKPAKYVFATSWQTAYWVAKYRAAKHKCYFVQDFEPWFYAQGSEYFLAENTYKLGLTAITAGTWLEQHLAAAYGMTTYGYTFSYDRELYKTLETPPRPRRSIVFYARPVTPRRCFELGLLALESVCKRLDDVDVIFVGWDISDNEIPFPHVNAGQLPMEQLPGIYATCDAALVLSGSNLSLMPMEIAACGVPLVINEGDYASWAMPQDCALYAPLEPDAIADALVRVLTDTAMAEQMADRAKAFVETSDWGVQADGVAAFLRKLDQPAA